MNTAGDRDNTNSAGSTFHSLKILGKKENLRAFVELKGVRNLFACRTVTCSCFLEELQVLKNISKGYESDRLHDHSTVLNVDHYPSGGVLTRRNPNMEVRDSRLARRVVSLDKELNFTLSLFTQVYKWVPATYRWG